MYSIKPVAVGAGLLLLLGACSSSLRTVKTFEDPEYAKDRWLGR